MSAEIETKTVKKLYGGCFCYACGIEIWFSDDFKTPFGKKIPLDIEQTVNDKVKFHECLEKKKKNSVKCQYCGEPISFRDNKLSKNGRKIPLSADGKENHECSKNPYNIRRNRNQSISIFRTGGVSENVHKTLEEKHAEFIKQEEEFRRQWR
jgi:hypothetical protein